MIVRREGERDATIRDLMHKQALSKMGESWTAKVRVKIRLRGRYTLPMNRESWLPQRSYGVYALAKTIVYDPP